MRNILTDPYDRSAFIVAVAVGTFLLLMVPLQSTRPLWLDILTVTGSWSVTYITAYEMLVRERMDSQGS